ncbi:tetratricopeptide repeat protein [Carbonactinospora thermoautotrophica]|uniref:tetratricopeptide repeat protein n=1 Tax=Carbonactinospora thermoautotrophica TaxID=1469144 RepID=UPI0008352B0C|nr:tetratricopeptide repeat protein [Carbonactinospora thermoautotrophica]
MGIDRQPNTALRAVRIARNESQREFAEAVMAKAREMGLNLACDEKRVGRWERGEVSWPTPAYRRVLKALTGKDAAELGFRYQPPQEWRDAEPGDHGQGDAIPGEGYAGRAGAGVVTPAPRVPTVETRPPINGDPAETVEILVMTPEGGLQIMSIPRRTLLAAAVATPFPPATPAHAAGPVPGMDVVDHLRELLPRLASLDQSLGARLVIGTAREQVALAEDLQRHARGELRTELLRLAGRYAEFVGWLYQDSGDLTSAWAWCSRAHDYAVEADDPVLAAFVIARKAFVSLYQQDSARVVALAQRARQQAPELPPRLVAYTWQQEACGYALDGDLAGVERAMEQAHRAVDAAEDYGSDAARDVAGFCTTGSLTVWQAWCYRELDRPDRAVKLYERALHTWPQHRRRGQGRLLSSWAVALAEAGEPEQAASTAREALPIVAGTRSALAREELRRLQTALAPYDVEPVRELMPTLASVR